LTAGNGSIHGQSIQMKALRLALVQMKVEGGAKERNLERAEARVAEAASQGAQIALLPEVMDLAWTHPAALDQAEAIPEGSVCQRLMKTAAAHQIAVCAGLTEKAGDAVFNSAVLIDSRGQLLIRHRKLHELDIGHDLYSQGDRLNAASTEFGTIGLLICADALADHQVLLRSLGYMGAGLILSPCAWAVPPGHDQSQTPYGDIWRAPYRTVAREFRLWIAGVSNVGLMTAGPWKGWNCIGCSLVVDPQGNEVLQGPYGAEADTVLYVDIKTVPRPARGMNWHKLWHRS
jgi:predicted amidohydrolase